jgi:ABC-type glutathione transport system ATPase component
VINSADARAEGFGQVNAGRLSLMASQVSDAFNTKTRVNPDAVWNAALLPPAAELWNPAQVMAARTRNRRPLRRFPGRLARLQRRLLRENHFAVEAIDLQVKQGEFIAIVGPSGCGKSTFMKLATGLKMPSMGKIRIDGQPVTGPLKISGMAFQAPSLLPWRTTVDNVLLPLEIVEPYRSQLQGQAQGIRGARARLLQKVGLGGYEDKFRGSSRAACSSAPASAAR